MSKEHAKHHDHQSEEAKNIPQQETAGSEANNENPTSESDDLSEIETLKGELAALKDKYLRHVAEFDNYRKRTAKEKIELVQTASKDVILSLLEVLDDSDRAIAQMNNSEDLEQIKSGTTLIFDKLRKTLEAKGLKEMDAKDKDFDVELHEAVTEIPAPRPDQVGKVVDELQKGYFLNDKIIRHAKVVVGK